MSRPRFALGSVNQDDFGILDPADFERLEIRDRGAVPWVQPHATGLDNPARGDEVDMPRRIERQRELLAGRDRGKPISEVTAERSSG